MFLTRPGFVDGQRSALKILLMKHADRFGSVFGRPHLDKSKAARPTRRAVLHDIDRNDRARLGEIILQVIFGCGEG